MYLKIDYWLNYTEILIILIYHPPPVKFSLYNSIFKVFFLGGGVCRKI